MRPALTSSSIVAVAIVTLGLNLAAYLAVAGRERRLEDRRAFLLREAAAVKTTAEEHEAARSRRQLVEALQDQLVALRRRPREIHDALAILQKSLPPTLLARRSSSTQGDAGVSTLVEVAGDAAAVEAFVAALSAKEGVSSVQVSQGTPVTVSFAWRRP